ncbi:hypothetical protein ACFGVR_18530 [Mucilaginibacter sp. AW1-3]
MDRNLRVLKNDILFAELVFIYETQVSGNVSVTMYGSKPIGDGLSTVFPLVTYRTEFSHSLLTTFDAIEEFDRGFLKSQPAPPQPEDLADVASITYDDSMALVYDAVHYRYVFNSPFGGIADVYANFIENTKELKFISGNSISGDNSASSNSFETNLNFCIRFANDNLIDPPTEFSLIGWR